MQCSVTCQVVHGTRLCFRLEVWRATETHCAGRIGTNPSGRSLRSRACLRHLPPEGATEQKHDTNNAEASEMSLPHPGGHDLIVGGAPQVVVKRELDGEIVADVQKKPAGGDPSVPKQASNDQLDEKTRHYLT